MQYYKCWRLPYKNKNPIFIFTCKCHNCITGFWVFFQSGFKFRYLEWKMWKSVCLSFFGLSFRAIHTFSFQLSTIFFLLKNLKFYFLFWRSPGDISNDILIPPGKVSFEPKTLLNIIFKSSMTSLIAVGFWWSIRKKYVFLT